jgi:hypothetical protein
MSNLNTLINRFDALVGGIGAGVLCVISGG